MTELKKKRVKTVLKYTWPFYIVAGILVYIVMSVIFRIAHPVPGYKSLTLFISGEVTDSKKLSEDMYLKYQDNNLKSFSCISSKIDDPNYATKLSVPGYNSTDVLIIPTSKLETITVSYFAIDLKEELINSYFQGYTFYAQEGVNYGVKVDVSKVNQYMTLPNEDCYMFLNGKSQNLGEYSLKKPNKDHNTALRLVRDWGM